MCSFFGLIDFKECLSTHTKNKILNTSQESVSLRARMRPASRIISMTACEFTAPCPLGK